MQVNPEIPMTTEGRMNAKSKPPLSSYNVIIYNRLYKAGPTKLGLEIDTNQIAAFLLIHAGKKLRGKAANMDYKLLGPCRTKNFRDDY